MSEPQFTRKGAVITSTNTGIQSEWLDGNERKTFKSINEAKRMSHLISKKHGYGRTIK